MLKAGDTAEAAFVATDRDMATFLEMEGRLFKFRVEAFDPAGKIGEGEHTRAVIDADRLINGAKKRIAGGVSGQ
jgi:fluoroacetyl-CoA thioesterase